MTVRHGLGCPMLGGRVRGYPVARWNAKEKRAQVVAEACSVNQGALEVIPGALELGGRPPSLR